MIQRRLPLPVRLERSMEKGRLVAAFFVELEQLNNYGVTVSGTTSWVTPGVKFDVKFAVVE